MSDLVQVRFDYGVLSPEQAQRTQEAEYRIIGRTQKTIVENGRDLLAVKQDIGHGHFRNWVQSIGISHDTAERWINIVTNFGEMTPQASFNEKALALLSTSKVPQSARDEAKDRAEAGEKITEEIARQIRDAHKAREEAEKTAQEALKRVQATQAQLFSANEQIAELEQQITQIQTPPVQIKEVQKDRPETLQQIEELKQKLKVVKESRDVNAEEIKKLTGMLNENRILNQQAVQQFDIRHKWRRDTKDAVQFLEALYLAIPSPHELQSFEPTDLDILAHVVRLAQEIVAKGQTAITSTHSANQGLIEVHANVY